MLKDLENATDNPVSASLRRLSTSANTIGMIQRSKLINAFHCGDYRKVVALYEEYSILTGDWDKLFMSSYLLPVLHFHCAIAFFACFHDTELKSHKRFALKEAKITIGLSSWGNPYYKHYGVMVAAEKLALDKKSFSKAEALFKEAIELTSANKIVQDEALSNERLGDLYLQHGRKENARSHFKEASNLYEKWGSVLRSKAVLCVGGRRAAVAEESTQDFQPATAAPVFSNGVFVVSTH